MTPFLITCSIWLVNTFLIPCDKLHLILSPISAALIITQIPAWLCTVNQGVVKERHTVALHHAFTPDQTLNLLLSALCLFHSVKKRYTRKWKYEEEPKFLVKTRCRDGREERRPLKAAPLCPRELGKHLYSEVSRNALWISSLWTTLIKGRVQSSSALPYVSCDHLQADLSSPFSTCKLLWTLLYCYHGIGSKKEE